MNTEYRYILEKGSKKYICPNCGKKRFVRYIDIESNIYTDEMTERCKEFLELLIELFETGK